MYSWLLLFYSLPPKPTSRRVYIWRKIKRLGAILHQNSAWVLPANPRTWEHFQWLAAEIVEMGGEANLWESRLISVEGEQALIKQFEAQANEAYSEVLRELKRGTADLTDLSLRYQKVAALDFFGSAFGRQVKEELLSARGDGADEMGNMGKHWGR